MPIRSPFSEKRGAEITITGWLVAEETKTSDMKVFLEFSTPLNHSLSAKLYLDKDN